ncbi:MAG: reverse transcriptase/maturase family protein [Mojavia pulchra JT2-VF2]|jgi:hypothetical protein|uniref:Reverse transcriptase/maturase family protein n=1 Tax=Mojavia pulchra JT2-VF2 TaxID=287848 RepID=A0A951Q7Y7_9NOST|nr:reverse transcriptase/maturase family protein [Mojavia pulchra JT2-VF2]
MLPLDSHIYAWYSHQISQLYEKIILGHRVDECVLAYRALGKSNIDFSKEVFDKIEQKAPCTALAFDLSKFFDNIDHYKLKQAWCEILEVIKLPEDHYKVYKSITNYAYVDRNAVFEEFGINELQNIKDKKRICSVKEFRERVRGKGLIQINKEKFGIPQGSPISAVLSNIFLLEFDKFMTQYAYEINGIYRRYCDDILWICPQQYTENIKSFVDKEIQRYGKNLFLNNEKTETSEFKIINNCLVGSPPLQYLGFVFDGQYRLIRPQTLARYYGRMKAGVRARVIVASKAGASQIYRKSLYENYSHLGSKNFIKYAYRSSITMESQAIRHQVRKHWKKLHQEINNRMQSP